MTLNASTTVFRDVSNSLKNLMLDNIGGLGEGDIKFESPADHESTGTKSISQFLFQIKFNDHMRNLGRRPAEISGGGKSLTEMREAPVIVDLLYMFTAYGSDQIVEMELLEQIIGVFYDYPVLKGDMLDGSLEEVGNEVIRITPVEFGTEVLNNIWSLFPNKSFKTSLFYRLSPVKILSNNIIEANRIITKQIEINKI